jgi:hypothetical protein
MQDTSTVQERLIELEKEIKFLKEEQNVEIMTAINDCNAIFKSFVEDIGRINAKLNMEMEQIKSKISLAEEKRNEEKQNMINLMESVKKQETGLLDELNNLNLKIKEEVKFQIKENLSEVHISHNESNQIKTEMDKFKSSINEIKGSIQSLNDKIFSAETRMSNLETKFQPSKENLNRPGYKMRLSSSDKDEDLSDEHLYIKLENKSLCMLSHESDKDNEQITVSKVETKIPNQSSSTSETPTSFYYKSPSKSENNLELHTCQISHISHPSLSSFAESLNKEIKISSPINVYSIAFIKIQHEKSNHHEFFLISGHKDGSILCWQMNLSNPALYKSFKEHSDIVDDIKQLRDKKFLSCSKDHKVKLWDLLEPSSLLTYENDSWTYCITVMPEHNLFATGDENGNIKFWRDNYYESPKAIIAQAHSEGVNRLLFLSKTKNKNLMVSASFDEIKVWDLDTCHALIIFKEHSDWINSLVELKDGVFISASGDKSIRVWCVHSTSTQSLKIVNVHTSNVSAVIPLNDVLDTCLNEATRDPRLKDIKQQNVVLTASLGNSSKIVNLDTSEVLAIYIRDEPIFKMEMMVDDKDQIKIAGCFWNSSNIKIWGAFVKM